MFKKIAYNCKQATFLIEKKQLTTLSVKEKFELKFHLAGCSVCRVFEKQSVMINLMVRQLINPSSNFTHVLSKDFKETMQKKIDREMENK